MAERKNNREQEQWITRQLEEKEAIIDGISDVLMLLDADTYEILDVNRAFLKAYGINRKEVLGKKCYEVTHHLNQPCHHVNSHWPCPLQSSVTAGKSSYAEHVHQDHAGETLYFEITTYPLHDADGRVNRIIHLSRDITQRKFLENEVKKSAEKYRTIFNSISNPVFVLDRGNLQVLDCNSNATAVYGFNKEELVDRSFMILFRQEERDHYRTELTASNVLNQVRQQNKEGQTFFVDMHVSPSEYAGREALLVTASDITEKLLAEQQLIQSSKMTTLGEMATGIAHELNQPLAVIKTASSFLIKKVNKQEKIKDEILKTLAEEIESYVDRAAKVINHMREFGRKSEVDKESVQINEVLNNALVLFSQQLKLKGIQVLKDLEYDLPLVLADANRLEQVFINLLINARDAIEEKDQLQGYDGEPRQIMLKTKSGAGMVTIEVKDTGTGIPPSILDKIFEPFFTTKKVGKGTGIGLSISYSIVQDYHGTIRVDSREGEGAAFVIRFPITDGT
jgi:histidine kinase